MTALIDYTCRTCGEPFQRRKRGTEVQQYCSRRCADQRHPIKHGTIHAYRGRGCRCDQCRTANNQYHKEQRLKRDPTKAPQHGKSATYANWGCRCEECSAAHAEQMRKDVESRKSRVDTDCPHGTPSGYGSWGCRCEPCTTASMARRVKQQWRENPEQSRARWRNYREKNREKLRERSRRWEAENREQKRERNRKWRAEHKEYCREKNRRWRAERKEYCRERTRLWRKKNPHAYAKYVKRYKDKINDSAWRSGFEWTGPELEIASRTDLTTAQVALMLHRTYDGVKWKRQQMKVDPRVIALAGVPRARKTA